MRHARCIAVMAALVFMIPALVGADGLAPAEIEALEGSPVSVRTSGGARFQGVLLDLLSDRLELIVTDGQIVQIALDEITDIIALDTSTGERTFFEDSAANRLVVMPTGFPLDEGEFHVASQEIIAVTGSYGINSWLSVWGGVSIPGALFSLRASGHLGEAVGASVGTFVGASWLDFSTGPLVLPYALVSFGTPADNLTAGGGFAMTFDDGFGIPGAVLAIGGKRTLTASTALVSENWIVWAERTDYNTSSGPSLSAVPLVVAPSAVFRIANTRLSWDIGAVIPFIIDGTATTGYYLSSPVIPIPILSITYRIE